MHVFGPLGVRSTLQCRKGCGLYTSPLGVVGVVGFFVHIDAQNDPWAAIGAVLAVGLGLWFIVVQARRRDERRARRRQGDDGPPRYR